MSLALQVMGLMCDGQYRLMQNYLREQRDNIHTIDLVGGVASFLQHFYHDINEETVELVHLILQTLIEVCVGNYSNQLVIFNQQILEALNSIFQIDITERHGEYAEKVSGPYLYMYTHIIILTRTARPLTPPIYTYQHTHTHTQNTHTTHTHNTHMWQSRVEIEHYSIVYFERITALKALYCSAFIKGGTHACYVDFDAALQHMSPALNGSTALQRCEHDNAVEICNRIMFDFYPGLPHMQVQASTHPSTHIHAYIGTHCMPTPILTQ